MSRAASGVSARQLLWASGCVTLALLPLLASLPVWVLLLAAAAAAIRLVLAAAGRDAPPRAVRLGIAFLCIALLFLRFRTFNGISAGTALLAVMAGLKLLETRSYRDIYVVILIGYFLSLAALLTGDSFWLLGYLVAVCWLTTATLLRLTISQPGPDWLLSLRYAARVLLQAVPLTVVLWLFFPRFAGPLWQVPDDGREATSGLGDTMSPGDIVELALSDEVAFRIRFQGAVPPARDRYFRGPVLHDFDGHTWRRNDPPAGGAPRWLPIGPAYHYTVSLEPHRHRWLFALDWPQRWDVPHATLTEDYMLVQTDAVTQALDVSATSYTRIQTDAPLSSALRRRDTRLPAQGNPRARALARELRAAHPQDWDLASAILAMFHDQPYYYTLTPPSLTDDSVDGFLFDTRRGFCGHYASAFALLMRAAGVPARVVTGYQGGARNRYADYWILRQSDAHAWDEIWIDGRGWVRIDPTSAIAPERVEHGAAESRDADEPLAALGQGRAAWLGDLRLRLDALREAWRRRILQFNQGSQQRLLQALHIPDPDAAKLVAMLAAGLALALAWLTWQVRRELLPQAVDPVVRAYARVCRRLRAVGLARAPGEAAEAYADRIAHLRPDLAPAVTALCRQYTQLRYGRPPPEQEIRGFTAAARSFRPARAALKPAQGSPAS
jgi:transglutaminase-like putative cysteine protease